MPDAAPPTQLEEEPAAIVQLCRLPGDRGFAMTFSGIDVRVGFYLRGARGGRRADELLDYGSVEELPLDDLGSGRFLVLGPQPGERRVYALEPALLDMVESFSPEFWYLAELVAVPGEEEPPEAPERDEKPGASPSADAEERAPEGDAAGPAVEGAMEEAGVLDDDEGDTDEQLPVEPGPDGHAFDTGDFEALFLMESEVTPVTKPFPGLAPDEARLEPGELVGELRRQLSWEREQRALAEAEVERLRAILASVDVEA